MVAMRECLGATIGAAVVTALPDIIYEVTARTVDIRGVLPLPLLAGSGAFAGFMIVSALNGIINRHQGVDTHEEPISADIWRLLKKPPEN